MFETLAQGGILMIPLGICSIVSLWLILERAFALQRRRVVREEIVEVIENLREPEDLGLARSLCERIPGPLASIVKVVLDRMDEPVEELKEAVEDVGRQELAGLERGLVVLETVAGVAPLLGLLGTVLGMIEVFRVISREGLGQAELLSGGISVALITTATGLTIGIPALVAYNYFTHKAARLILEVEGYVNALLTKIRAFREERAEVVEPAVGVRKGYRELNL